MYIYTWPSLRVSEKNIACPEAFKNKTFEKHGLYYKEDGGDLSSKIDSYVSKQNGTPGLICSTVNKNGPSVFECASGTRGVSSDELMSVNAVFWIASCTEMITAVAAMQLADQRKLALDNEDQTEHLLPDLEKFMVLGELPDRK